MINIEIRTVVTNEDSLILGIYKDSQEYKKELELFLKGKEIVSKKEKIVNDIKRIKIVIKE